jgi:hypothetical protein
MTNYRLLTDLPPIPDNLILPIEEVLELENHGLWDGITERYTLHRCQDELSEYLKEMFPESIGFWYHTIVQELPIHQNSDFSEFYNRKLPSNRLNYVIDAGGDNVQTNWYNTGNPYGELIETVVFPERVWHELEVFVYHNVNNIDEGRRRFAITGI